MKKQLATSAQKRAIRKSSITLATAFNDENLFKGGVLEWRKWLRIGSTNHDYEYQYWQFGREGSLMRACVRVYKKRVWLSLVLPDPTLKTREWVRGRGQASAIIVAGQSDCRIATYSKT